MHGLEWGAAALIGFWGFAHVLFGLATLVPACKNDVQGVFLTLLDGHPFPDALKESTNVKFIKGPHALLRQHGLNLIIIGAFALITCFLFVPSYHFTAYAFFWLIYFDHNAYGLSMDMAGYVGPAGKLFLYVYNVAHLLFAQAYYNEGGLCKVWYIISLVATIVAMVAATVMTIYNKVFPPTKESVQVTV